MIQANDSGLHIHIDDASPLEWRDTLIKAIAASIRWNGTCDNGEKYTDDGQNLIILAQLLESLVDVQPD